MPTRDQLYGLTVEPLANMNQRAHRGGGVEVVEVPSGEGFVEDQYEAQLKGLYVAYREPTAVKLAALATQLEVEGFVSFAEKVDDVLAGFYQPEFVKLAAPDASQIDKSRRTIIHNARVAKDIIEKGGAQGKNRLFYIDTQGDIIKKFDKIIAEVSAQQVNWDTVAADLAFLTDEHLLYGKFDEFGEPDLESGLGAQFPNYKQALDNIDAEVKIAQALTSDEAANKEQFDTGERAKLQAPAPDAADPRPYISNAQALNQQISNLQQTAELVINRQPNDQKRAQVEAQITRMFQQAAPLFSYYRKKALPAIGQIQAMTPEVKSTFDPVLQQIRSSVSTLKAQMELL